MQKSVGRSVDCPAFRIGRCRTWPLVVEMALAYSGGSPYGSSLVFLLQPCRFPTTTVRGRAKLVAIATRTTRSLSWE